jgi:hypothetical protein
LSEEDVIKVDEIHPEVVAEIHAAVQGASRDYFIWTKGRILYDDGVESLVQVYAAKRLFDLFASQYELQVRMEEPVAKFLGNIAVSGRIDLTLRFGSELSYAIEIKRYTNNASIRSDLDRLRTIVNTKPNCVGLFAAPCYVKDGTEQWPGNVAEELASQNGVRCHLSGQTKLPGRYQHAEGWRADQTLIIEVARTGDA